MRARLCGHWFVFLATHRTCPCSERFFAACTGRGDLTVPRRDDIIKLLSDERKLSAKLRAAIDTPLRGRACCRRARRAVVGGRLAASLSRQAASLRMRNNANG